MTDMEMDLMIANAENKALKETIERLRGEKCIFGDGVIIKPDGVHQLDPCIYETIEVHRNVTVEVMRCRKCGHIEIMWHRQADTESSDCSG